jgi:hypothetical protein
MILAMLLHVFLLLSFPPHASVMKDQPGPPIVQSTEDIVPDVAFCEMVKHPELYFDKSVRVTAILEQAEESQYLSDAGCELSHDDQIGVGYVTGDTAQQALRDKSLDLIHSPEYGNRASVTVVGILRNASRRDFAWYRYRFDIVSFESVSHITEPYQGELQAGKTYVAAVYGDGRGGLSLANPVRMSAHYAVRVEWTNRKSFPALKQISAGGREGEIVFSVLTDDTRQMTANRWNRTIRCRIIRIN